MKRACIVTVDAARARIYLYQEQTKPGFELVEIGDLDNAGRRLKDADVFSETRPARKTNASTDDHRDAHIEVMDSRFARLLVAELDDQVRRRKLGHLVIIAPPRMLGAVRAVSDVLHRDGLVLEEVDKDLSHLTAAQLHDYLADAGIVPARQRRAAAR